MDDLLNELRIARDVELPIITVAGVGGGGGNAVNHMYEEGISGVNFMICNTDKQALDKSPVQYKIILGDGSGAGNDPSVGREKTIEGLDAVKKCFENFGTQMLFLTAGMGGGTGTGASPVIARLAREMGILTVAIVTTPKTNEGPKRRMQAQKGIEELREYIDSILVIENDSINKIYGKDSLYDGFRRADEVLTKAAKGIAELITVPGEHNVDFADVKNVLSQSGRAHFSVATADGPNRIEELVERSLHSPLMDKSIAGARDAIVNISAASFRGENAITQDEFDSILESIRSAAGLDSKGNDVNIIWGTTEKPELGDALELVLVATRFDEAAGERKHIEEAGGPIVLSMRSNRFADLETKMRIPAYQRRNFEMITDTPSRGGSESGRTKTHTTLGVATKPVPQSSSLFDDEN